jgi:hypothetical protein
MTDVERWPEWTSSVTSLQRLDTGRFATGSRARIKQPRLAAAVWTVTEVRPGHSFTWVSRVPGLRTIGYHGVTAAGSGSEASLEVRFEGIFAGIAALLFGKLTEECLEKESKGLKHRCENKLQ